MSRRTFGIVRYNVTGVFAPLGPLWDAKTLSTEDGGRAMDRLVEDNEWCDRAEDAHSWGLGVATFHSRDLALDEHFSYDVHDKV